MRIKLKKKKFVIHDHYYFWYSNIKCKNDYDFAILRNYVGDYFYVNSVFWKKYIEYMEYNFRKNTYIYHICG